MPAGRPVRWRFVLVDPMGEELSTGDAKTLLALCASGRLYAIEAWVQAGRSLQVPRALRRTPLDVAITIGFHSLIELLLRHAPSQQAKNDALHQAVQRRRRPLLLAAPQVPSRAREGVLDDGRLGRVHDARQPVQRRPDVRGKARSGHAAGKIEPEVASPPQMTDECTLPRH